MAQAHYARDTPIGDSDDLVPRREFRKHPLARDNPWLRPDPDRTYRMDRHRIEEGPYEELERRGAEYDGEDVTVVYEMRIHALAPGTAPAMLYELRQHPDLVDSLDVSTPERAPGNHKVPDATWTQDRHLFPRGDGTLTLRAQHSVSIALQLAHMLSPLCNEETFETVLTERDNVDTETESRLAEAAAQDDGIRTLSQWADGD